jgi:hypothetical protein
MFEVRHIRPRAGFMVCEARDSTKNVNDADADADGSEANKRR